MSTIEDTMRKNETRQDEILENIKKLQSMETELYQHLQRQSGAGLERNEQERIVEKINTLSGIRTSMFKELTNMYGNILNRVSNTRGELVDKMTVTGVVEKELDNAKKNMNALKNERNNKLRMVEINTYYGKQYDAHTNVMKMLIFICVPILILAVLRKKGFITETISRILIGIVALVGSIFILLNVIDLSQRNNMNYDEYNWPSMNASGKLKNYVPPPKQLNDNGTMSLGVSGDVGCVGEKCCSNGTSYDNNLNKCVTSVNDDKHKHDYLQFHHHRV